MLMKNQKIQNGVQLVDLNCPVEYRRPELVLDINTFSKYLFIKDLYDYLYKKKPWRIFNKRYY